MHTQCHLSLSNTSAPHGPEEQSNTQLSSSTTRCTVEKVQRLYCRRPVSESERHSLQVMLSPGLSLSSWRLSVFALSWVHSLPFTEVLCLAVRGWSRHSDYSAAL